MSFFQTPLSSELTVPCSLPSLSRRPPRATARPRAGESIPAALARAAGLVPADCVAGASGPFCAAALLEVAAGVRENADHGRIIVAPSADHVAIRMLLIFTAADAQAATQAGYFDHENVETAMRAAAATLSFQRGGSEEGKDVTAGAEA